MEDLLRKSKKLKRGATLEDDDVDGAWPTSYARIARRCHDDKDLGVSRYPYELAPGLSPFSGGYFKHREWAIRRGMERHPSLRTLFEYEDHYTNSAGYWMSFSSAVIDLRGEALKLEGTTGVEEAERFDAWAMMAVRAIDDLDDVMEKLDTYIGHPTDEGCRLPTRHKCCAAYRGRRICLPVFMSDRRPPQRNSESSREGCSERLNACAAPFTLGFWSNPPSLPPAAKS
jgi:hypothetical protein